MAEAFAYRVPAVLARVAQEVKEPYRSLLLIHPHVRMPRIDLCQVRLADVDIDGDGQVRLAGRRLADSGRPTLLAYLRGYRMGIESEWLFPMPRDADRPVSPTTASRRLARVVKSEGPSS